MSEQPAAPAAVTSPATKEIPTSARVSMCDGGCNSHSNDHVGHFIAMSGTWRERSGSRNPQRWGVADRAFIRHRCITKSRCGGSPCNPARFWHVARPYVEPRDLEHEEEARVAGDAPE